MIATLSDLQTIPITIPINVDITIHANNVHKKYPSDAGSAAWKNTGAVRIISVQTTIELIMLLIAIDKNTCHNLIPPIMYALLICKCFKRWRRVILPQCCYTKPIIS